jgi:hypothetical protein
MGSSLRGSSLGGWLGWFIAARSSAIAVHRLSPFIGYRRSSLRVHRLGPFIAARSSAAPFICLRGHQLERASV